MPVLRHLHDDLGDLIWGEAGLSTPFARRGTGWPKVGWPSIRRRSSSGWRNHRSGLIWRLVSHRPRCSAASGAWLQLPYLCAARSNFAPPRLADVTPPPSPTPRPAASHPQTRPRRAMVSVRQRRSNACIGRGLSQLQASCGRMARPRPRPPAAATAIAQARHRRPAFLA